MKSPAKFFPVLLAVLIVLLPLIVNMAVGLRRIYVKQHIHKLAELEATELLCLDSALFIGLESGDEIDINNKRYDIKEVNVSNGKIYAVAVNDKLEKAIENASKNTDGSNTQKIETLVLAKYIGSVFRLASPNFVWLSKMDNQASIFLFPATLFGVFHPPEV